MSRQTDHGDEEFTHNPADIDPLGVIYSEIITPDIEEMTEHAEKVAEDKKPEEDEL